MTPDKLVKGNVVTHALRILGHVAADENLAARFIAETGQDPAMMARRAADPDLLAAVTDFISKDEQALLACAAAIGLPPQTIAGVAAELNPVFDGD